MISPYDINPDCAGHNYATFALDLQAVNGIFKPRMTIVFKTLVDNNLRK